MILLYLDAEYNPDILRGSPRAGLKQGRGGKISSFLSLSVNNLKNDSRYGYSYN